MNEQPTSGGDNGGVAGLIESLMSVTDALGAAARRCKPISTGPRDRALRRARLCYDHLAGEVAVGIAASMVARGQLTFDQDGGVLADEGMSLLTSLGVQLDHGAPKPSRQATFCRPCLDWSERRPHIAGLVGRALWMALLKEGWVGAPTVGRAVSITRLGQQNLERHFGMALVYTATVLRIAGPRPSVADRTAKSEQEQVPGSGSSEESQSDRVWVFVSDSRS